MILIVLPKSIVVVHKENKSSLGSVKSHIGVMFDCEETNRWNSPGISLFSKLLIFPDVDILSRFHIMEAVVLIDVYFKPSLVII